MKRSLLIGFIAVTTPFAALAQTSAPATTTPSQVAIPNPGLVPGDFFYFLDRWGEDIRSFFTFDPEAKARLALEHAQERAAEINTLLQKKGVDAPEIAQTKKDFEDELTQATNIVADEKAKGVDVSGLAGDINNEFEHSKDMLKSAYHGYGEDLKRAEKDLREQLKEAIKVGDTTAQAAIQNEIENIASSTAAVLDEEGSVDSSLGDEKDNLDQAMGSQQSAESHIANAERAYGDLMQFTQEKGITPDQNTIDEYQKLLKSAKDALAAGDFETAIGDAKEAKSVLGDAHEGVDTKETEDQFFNDMNGEDQGAPEMMGGPEGGPERHGPEGRGQKSEVQGSETGQPGMNMMPTRENAGEPDFRPDMGGEGNN